jgi:hypothetical protein
MYMTLCGIDCVEPRRIILSGVAQETHAVSRDERRTGGARESLIGKQS